MITTAPELIYMLKVNIGIALFYAFYKLFCCRDTFFQWRRIALLSFLALSFLYPLMDMQAWVKEQPAINELADYYALMMLTETNTSTATVVTAPVAIPTPDLLDIIKFVYWIGILLLSARFMIQLSSIFRLVLKSKNINVDQISIRLRMPTCTAARPTPLSLYMVSNISSTKVAIRRSNTSTVRLFFLKIGSPYFTTFRNAIFSPNPSQWGSNLWKSAPFAVLSF